MASKRLAGYLALTAAALVAATLLRLALLPREALDGDEVFTRSVSIGPLPAGWSEIQRDLVHPPLYYLALRGVLALGGDTPLSLRVLSIAAAAGILVLAAAWVRRLAGGWSWACLAVLLLALSPVQLAQATQARGYALYGFLVLGAAVLLGRALDRPAETRGWAWFSILALAAMMTHYVAAIYLACTLFAVLGSREPRVALPRWAMSLAVPAAALVAWLASIWPHYRAKGGLYINMSWVEEPGAFQFISVYAGFAGQPTFPRGTTLALLVTAAVVVAGIAAIRSNHRAAPGSHAAEAPGVPAVSRADWALLAALALLPPAALLVLGSPPVALPIWGARHAFPSQAFWLIAMVLLVREVAREHRGAAVVLSTALVALQALALRAALIQPVAVPYDAVATFLTREVEPCVPVQTASPHNVGLPVEYYLAGAMEVDSFENVGRAPSVFWLLYRPDAAAERAQFDALVARGWRIDQRARFGGAWGTTAVLLVHR